MASEGASSRTEPAPASSPRAPAAPGAGASLAARDGAEDRAAPRANGFDPRPFADLPSLSAQPVAPAPAVSQPFPPLRASERTLRETLARLPESPEAAGADGSASPDPVVPARSSEEIDAMRAPLDAIRRKDLLSPAVDAAVAAAFDSLGDLVLPQKDRTVEDLVKEILRPMLKEWLDKNLPEIVERLVRAEIERVSGGRR